MSKNPSPASPNNEELLFEYDQLRTEIIHNSTLTTQITAGILTLGAALMAIAFSEIITNLAAKGFLLLVLIPLIAAIGMWQTLDRSRSTYVIASYLRIFIEPLLKNVRWETRLHEFRKHSKGINPSSQLGEFTNYQLLTYLFLLLINFILVHRQALEFGL